jgi:hypothetical protein
VDNRCVTGNTKENHPLAYNFLVRSYEETFNEKPLAERMEEIA